MAKKTMGELNGWNARMLVLTIWGGPVLTGIIGVVFTVIAWPWILDTNKATASVPYKLDIAQHAIIDRVQTEKVQKLIADEVGELKDDMDIAHHEINEKLDRLIWERVP